MNGKNMIIILMGVSGSGKTTVGKMLSSTLGWEFIEGDEYHPRENIEKMSMGIPLTDEDRIIWLDRLSNLIRRFINNGTSVIIACSALKQDYRNRLTQGQEEVKFVYLKGEYELIERRLNERKGHYFDPGLLKSQFSTLEEPEDAVTIEITDDPKKLSTRICRSFYL